MPTLMLMRMKPLTEEERKRLPFGCRPVDDKNTVVARADVELALSETFKLAVAMGRAVPDASFAYHEKTAPGAEVLRMPAPNWSAPFAGLPEQSQEVEGSEEGSSASEYIEDAEIIEDLPDEKAQVISEEPPKTWKDFLAEGDIDAALSAVESQLDAQTRIDLRNMLSSEDPQQAIFVCKLARKIEWKSLVLPLRNAFRHPNFEVRKEACLAVGELAGPSMSPFVHLLLSDPSTEVQQAARVTLKKLERTR